MAFIARLAGEGIGPFKSFDFDFSDAEGKPHPGPHIFAGINGSGKSTVLRTLAWLFQTDEADGFQWEEWQHFTQGYPVSRAMIVLAEPSVDPQVIAQTTSTVEGWELPLHTWIRQQLAVGRIETLKGILGDRAEEWPDTKSIGRGRPPIGRVTKFNAKTRMQLLPPMLAAAYGPSRLLRYLPQVRLEVRLNDCRQNALSFEATVQNEVIQSWLLELFSKRSIAQGRGENASKYSAALDRFENALSLMLGQDAKFNVELEPSFQPKLMMYGKALDFSQLPDGVRSTVGWLADFLMRIDMYDSESPTGDRSYALFLDEVDAHLHPRWQRSILPSIKQALPETQVFATSHSPFVIGSCPGARIHVLELDADGVAHNRPPIDAPVGESILATIKDIFGVTSRFDIETERLVAEWNDLHRGQAKGPLSTQEKERMAGLVRDLSSRSEELRQMVSPVVSINHSLVASLKSQAQKGEQSPRRKGKRG